MTYHDLRDFFYLLFGSVWGFPVVPFSRAWVKGFSLVSSLVGPRGVAMIPRCNAKAWLTWCTRMLDARNLELFRNA